MKMTDESLMKSDEIKGRSCIDTMNSDGIFYNRQNEFTQTEADRRTKTECQQKCCQNPV